MPNHKLRRGFTLVEMLVVIAIIAVLAALLVPAVMVAITAARNAAIAVEVNQLTSAIESYKQDKGDYPPNFRDQNIVLRHIRKCYPKADPAHVTNVVNYACQRPDGTIPDTFIDEGEALVFWLSMTDNDPRYPFLSFLNPSGQTPSPKKYYDFEEPKLVRLNPLEAPLVNNVGQFYDVRAALARFSKDTCYLYIDSRSYQAVCKFRTVDGGDRYAFAEDTSIGARPYWSDTTQPVSSPTNDNRSKYKPMNATTFQILCAGQDGEFGDPTVISNVKFFPSDSNNMYEPADRDNITNFSNGKTLKDNLP